jgi:3-oxoadipate enol-lactonase
MIPRNTSLCVRVLCGLMAILSAAGLEAAQQTAATAQASTGFVDVDGGKLYYEESNHGGQTVVLTHDGVVDSAVWNDVCSSHGGQLAVDFALARPEFVEELVLVGPLLSGMPYTQYFLDRAKEPYGLLQKGDVKGAISEWSKDKFLIGPQNDGARRKLLELLTANPQRRRGMS